MISPVRGLMYAHYGIRSFNAQDIMEVLRSIRALSAPDARLALHLDNARIHYAIVVRELARSPEINIELVWNVAYR